ncbi:MAG TPA: DMT family transporter [Caulobacteraceae bacterium]|jgi:drug/metabolite transporter (DMT)-like permease|nr:DMT family transporter [Caulobacteraceae bacterium]
MLWIPVTVAAAAFQVARNAAQRGLMGNAGPWGATLTRFLFGFPFTLAFTVLVWGFVRPVTIHPSSTYLAFALTGAAAQVLATAALLTSMHRAGFAVGTALQQSSLPLSGLLGWLVFHDRLSGPAWVGIAIATAGLVCLSWPKARAIDLGAPGARPVSGAAFALLSGLLFGFSLNAYRHASLVLEPHHPLLSAAATVTFTQMVQSLVLGAILAVRYPATVQAVLTNWRASLMSGFCGACASTAWGFALVLAPAAAVRAVGVIEAPIAAAVGRRLFAERLSPWKLAAGALTALGVVLTALG